MEVAVLGLGEAGGRIAADLVAAGCTVRGWDPGAAAGGHRRTPASDREAVRGADVVLSLNTAAVALDAAARRRRRARRRRALRRSEHGRRPQLKRELAAALPVPFADVALIGVVPSLGLTTPALASGAGAERFAELFRPLGMPVEVVGAQPGRRRRPEAAAQRLHEGHRGGGDREPRGGASRRRRGARPRRHRGRASASRCSSGCSPGSHAHAARRVDEMSAAAAYVEELGVEPRVAPQPRLARAAPRRQNGLRSGLGGLGRTSASVRTPRRSAPNTGPVALTAPSVGR